ncbi:hypothetical protein [Bartonella raoultii]|uniref:hypothetical protein n=1 Tax=Bartonella raoultii TaxID=1457020 RepID=UPI001ABA9126|nr:hypothetical protein [Bartonella raoultii]
MRATLLIKTYYRFLSIGALQCHPPADIFHKHLTKPFHPKPPLQVLPTVVPSPTLPKQLPHPLHGPHAPPHKTPTSRI